MDPRIFQVQLDS
jgi:hypothetical protein